MYPETKLRWMNPLVAHRQYPKQDGVFWEQSLRQYIRGYAELHMPECLPVPATASAFTLTLEC
jgi:hypothetical protein